MSKDLNDHIKDHFERVSPEDDQMRHLMDMASLKSQAPARSASQRWQWVAVFPLLVLLGGLWFEKTHQPRGDMAAQIAEEIAINHDKHPTPDVYADTYDALAAALKVDGFAILPPVQWSDPSYRLVGGRLCSLSGQKAVQIHLEGQDGTRVTLYQTKYAPHLASSSGQHVNLRSKDVRLWHENGRYYGLASEEDS